MLLMAERRDLILQELIKEGSVYVSELKIFCNLRNNS